MANIFDQFDAVEASGNIFDQFDVRVKPKEERSDFVRGAKEAFQQLPQLGYGVVAGAGAAIESAVGEGGIATGIKKAGVKGYQEWGDKIAKDAKESDSFSYSYDKAKEGDFGAMVDWLQHGLGYAGGQGIQMLTTAGIGSVVGKAGLKVAAEKLASGMVAKESARIAAAEGGAELAADQIAKMATANVAAKIGQTAAIGATAYGMEGGEIGGDMAAKSVAENRSLTGEELAKAFGATLAAGSLEFIGDKVGLDVMLGKSALTKPAASMAGLGGRAVRGTIAAAGAAPIEGATEYGQTLLEEYGKGNDPFSEESRKQAGDAAALGALGGAAMGGAGGTVQSVARPAEKNRPPADPLLLTNDPDPYISFQDGTVGRRADVENYVNSLPEDQRIDVRARLFGLGAQAVEQPSIDSIIGAQSVDEAIDAAKTVINDSSAIDAQLKNEQIDTAWRAYAANLSKQREREFASAEQSRREADIQAAQQQIADQRVELANAITQAQGFDTPEPTAMQLAMQKAAERKKLMLTPVSKRTQSEISNVSQPATSGVQVRNERIAGTPNIASMQRDTEAGRLVATQPASVGQVDAGTIAAVDTASVPDSNVSMEQSAALSGIKAEVAKIEARRSARTEKPAAVKQPILADSAPSSTPMVDAIQGGEQPMLKSVTQQSAMADFGLLNERDPGVIASLQKLAEMQSAEIPKFTPVKNGFSAREYATKFGPRQEIKAPNGAIAARGLDTNGKPYFEMSGNGTLGQFMSGAPFHEFNDYFNNKSGGAEDRRTDFSRRKTVSEMSPEEMRKSLLISELAGLPNKRAFDEHVHDNPSDNVLYGDLDDFKSLNSRYGHDGADQILRGVGAVKAMVANRMGVKPYHRSGDEFLATHANNAKLETYGKELQDELANASFNITMPDGSIVVHKKVGFSYGTGQNQQLAERKSDEQKSERKQLGLRVGQREAIPVAGEGRQDNQRDAAGRDNTPSRQVTADQTSAASKILDAAGITGAERIDRLKDIKSGAISLDELRQAYPAKEATIAEPVKEKRAKEATPKATQAEEAEDNPALFFKQGDFPQSETFKTKTDANLFKAKNKLQATAEHTDDGWTLHPVAGPLTESERIDAVRDVRQLNKVLAAEGVPAVEPLKVVPTANHALARKLGAVFGIKVQFVSNNGAFDGVAHKGIAYLTEKLSRPELAIAGHEVFHALEQTNPALAEDLLGHIRGYLKDDVVADRKLREDLMAGKPVSERYAVGEVVADLNGSMWLDPKFWREMAQRDQNLFRQVAYKFMEVAARAVKSLTGTRFDVKALVSDVDAVRSLIAQTWADRNQGRDRKESSEMGLKFSRAQEGTEAFRKWFGDSKVVDSEGKPMVVYHGTPNGGFANFSDEKKGMRTAHTAEDVGFHFTDSASYAESYSEGYKIESIEAYRQMFGKEPAGTKMPEAAATYPVYLSIKNPLRVTASKQINKVLIEQATAGGHDGIIADMGGATEYVAFEPSQIKSATGNNGDFDPANPDIRFSRNIPDAVIGGVLGDLSTHSDYAAAKAGDIDASIRIADEVITPELIHQIKQQIGKARPIVQPVFAIESSGQNKIPIAAAASIAKALGLPVGTDIVQSSSPKRTQLTGLDRIFRRPEFAGDVADGESYLLVDDTLTQGGTFAAMVDHIESRGGMVIGTVALTGKQYSAKIALSEQTLGNLREKFGDIEQQFQRATGHGFDVLTESEARYLINFKPADAVRDRILAEGRQGSDEDSNDQGPQDSDGLSFSRSNIIGNNERARTPEQLRAFKNVGRTIEVPTLKERMAVLWQDAGKKLAQGMADQFAPIKELSEEAYALMRLSKGAGGAFETMLRGGQLKLENGVYNFDDTKRGGVIDRLLTPLQGEMDDFLWWVSANRADKLSKEDREHLFSTDDIAALKSLDNGVTKFSYELQHGPNARQTTHDRTLIYRDALQTFNEFHKNALDMAEQSGLIDPDARKLWESEFYVPFYRVDEESGVRGANIKSGVVRQQAFKTLKGGSGKLNSDLLDNTLQNWAHLLDSAAKNRAAKASLNAAVNMGVAVESTEEATRQMAKSIGRRNNVVWYMDSGKQRYFLVEDPYIMTALQGLEYAGMKGPLMDALSTMKHALTVGVTASPFFKVRNLIRDSVQAIGVSPLDYNVGANLKQGWKLTDPKSDAYFKLLAGGGTIHFGTMLEGSESKRVRSLVESGVDAGTILDNESKYKAFYKRVMEPAIDAYQELGNRGEAINRAALYDQLIKQGKSHAEASLMARDLMDFSMGGAWAGIRFLTQVVPFMNARIQGLYKLGKSAKEDPARFATVLGAVAMSSIALMLAYSDDEDWKKREDWDRDSYWWFKIGGEAFRVPKPFEIGAIGTLAERGIEYFTSDEMTGNRLRKRLYALLSDNLAMNPTPQLVKPILDIYANKDSFSGRPIETMGMEKLKSEYRFTRNTSMAARGISTVGNAIKPEFMGEFSSPMQIDHMIKGYFGWLGALIVGTGDLIARPATSQPGGATPDYWKTATGGMISDANSPSSRYVSQMYDQAKVLEEAYGTYRMLVKQGKVDEAREFAADNADSLRKYKSVESVKRVEARLNERMRAIERSSKSSDEKRELIQQIQSQKDKIARQLSR
jgi:GGDEF domain-containing protein/adenine/guanine phosphoribosyltransferase-like PRPP-binding protein